MKLSEKIRYAGVDDHREKNFENQWPLPKGISYNAYLVIDKKIALIDTADAAFADEFLRNIQAKLGDRRIDYLIVNHMEPDHSALLSLISREYPEVTIVTNAKAVPMIEGYHGITERIQVIREGESLPLGETSLQFFMVPMVHWPETMVTWCPEEKTLFSGDAFGCFGALNGNITDSKSSTFEEYKDEMIRYYANIVGKYGTPVQNALKKLGGLDIHRICSTHGPIWERQIADVVSLYDKMSRYEPLEHGVCIAFGSMYGNTEKAALELAEQLREREIPYTLRNLTAESYSFALRDVFRFDTLVVGSPTYNNEIFPPVRQFLEGIRDRQIKNRRFAAFGSFTWAGGSVKQMTQMAVDAGFEILREGLSFKQGYMPGKCDFDALADLCR
jgi:flavorubredoxin